MRLRTNGNDGRVGARVTKAVSPYVVVVAILLVPATVVAQQSGDAAYIAGRLTGLQQQLADLSARLEQLKSSGSTASTTVGRNANQLRGAP